MRTTLHFLALLAPLPLALSGCIANDDADDAAFVSRVVPAVLGRKVHGAVELDVLTQVAETYGRQTLVEILMDQPEFVQYWSHVLAEDLEVQYGTWAAPYAQNPDCFNTAAVVTTLDDHAAAQSLATFVRGQVSTTAAYPTPFTMLDALRAGILADDLLVPYRAGLFPLADKTGQESFRGEQFFNQAYLGRDADCLSCHSSTWSTTDDQPANGGWDRFAPAPIDVEGGLYSTSPLPPGNCGTDAGCLVFHNCYQCTSCEDCHGATGQDLLPQSDGDQKTLAQRVRVLTDEQILAVVDHGIPSKMPGYSTTQAVAVLGYLRRTFGTAHHTDRFFSKDVVAVGSGTQPLGMSTTCASKVNPSVPIAGRSDNPNVAYPLVPVFGGTGYLTPSPFNLSRRLATAGMTTATSWLSGQNVSYGAPAHASPSLPGSANVGFAVSQRIVDNVLQEIWGERHTLGHGFERSEAQSEDRSVRAAQFMDEGWSLRYLVRSAVLSEHFNRRAPAESLAPTGYALPVILNPWAMVEPGTGVGAPGEDTNGQGDAVHRYTPDNLYWSLHHGLGWREPDIVEPTNADFPTYDFRQRVGDYTGFFHRGATAWSMGGLLYWESAVGTCSVANAPGGVDWVTELLDEAYASPGSYVVGDLVAATRDRLLSSPTLVPGEEAELLGMMTTMGLPSIPNLSVPLTGWSRAQIEPFVRSYCGALLTTPDYLLGGLPLVDALPTDWPAIEACLPGEPCGAADTCAFWADALTAENIQWTTCNDIEPPGAPPPPSDPVDPTDRVSMEDALAADHGYSTATEYDKAIAQALVEEAAEELAAWEAWDEDAAAKAEAARRAEAERYSRVCQDNRDCDAVAEAWVALGESDARLAAADAEAFAPPLDADGNLPASWEREVWPTFGDWRVQTLEAQYLAELGADEVEAYRQAVEASNAANVSDEE